MFAMLDNEAQLDTCGYIDFNPLAAGIAAAPKTSKRSKHAVSSTRTAFALPSDARPLHRLEALF
jgi:hypothetical protein